MRKLGAFLIFFAAIVALFSINNIDKTFSFEAYLDNISIVADDRPTLPSTEAIENTIDEYDETQLSDNPGIIKSLKHIWTTLKLIFQIIVYVMKFFVYLIQSIFFIIRFISACFYNLIVW